MPHLYDLNPKLKPKAKAVKEQPETPAKKSKPKKEVKE